MSREQQERDNIYLCPSCVSYIEKTDGCKKAYQWLVGETTVCREYKNAERHEKSMKNVREIMDRDREVLEKLKDGRVRK